MAHAPTMAFGVLEHHGAVYVLDRTGKGLKILEIFILHKDSSVLYQLINSSWYDRINTNILRINTCEFKLPAIKILLFQNNFDQKIT